MVTKAKTPTAGGRREGAGGDGSGREEAGRTSS